MNRRNHLGCLVCGLAGLGAATRVFAAADPGGAVLDATCLTPSDRERLVRVVAIGTPDPPIDRSLTTAELTRKARDLGNLHARLGRVLGLTTARFSYELGHLRVDRRSRGQEDCVNPVEIAVALRVVQDVSIVRAKLADPCWDPAILAHEMQHVQFNNDAIEMARRELDARLGKLAPLTVVAADTQNAGNRLTAEVKALVVTTMEAALAVARDRHASIDTPAGYARVLRSCGL